MKTITKILILLVALALTVTAIMIYARSKVAPPISIKQVDQYQLELEDFYDRLKKETKLPTADKEVADALSLVKIMDEEKKISINIRDSYVEKFITAYSKLLMKECFTLFSKSDWNTGNIKNMSPRLQLPLDTKNSKGKSVITVGTRDSLVLCQSVIQKYRTARSIVASSNSFQGVESTKSKLNSIASLMSDSYLKNNKSLIKELSDSRLSLQRSHFNYVKSQVDRLGRDGYLYLSEDYYDNTLVKEVNIHLRGYYDLFGDTSISELSYRVLQDLASKYINDARQYYDERGRR